MVQQTFGERRWEIPTPLGGCRPTARMTPAARDRLGVEGGRHQPTQSSPHHRGGCEGWGKNPSTHPSGQVYARYIQAVKDGNGSGARLITTRIQRPANVRWEGQQSSGNRWHHGRHRGHGRPARRSRHAGLGGVRRTSARPPTASINAGFDDRIGAVDDEDTSGRAGSTSAPRDPPTTAGRWWRLMRRSHRESKARLSTCRHGHRAASRTMVCRRLRTIEDKPNASPPPRSPRPPRLQPRSDDASTNEVATAAAAVDDGWRTMLVAYRLYDNNPPAIGGFYAGQPVDDRDRRKTLPVGGTLASETTPICGCRGDIPANAYQVPRLDHQPTPNLAEWYKPKAAAFRDTAAVNADTLKDYDAACAPSLPPTASATTWPRGCGIW